MKKNNEVHIFDFGNLKVYEESLMTPKGLPYTRLSFHGPFDGFEKGESGSVFDYFEHDLLKRTKRIIIVFKETKYFSDAGPVLVQSAKMKLKNRNGNVIITNPSKAIEKILTLIRWPFVKTEEEAISILDGEIDNENCA